MVYMWCALYEVKRIKECDNVPDDELKPYFMRNTKLKVECDCLIWEFQIVITSILRPQMRSVREHIVSIDHFPLARYFVYSIY